MGRGIDHFVILADMRTGSNALEERLNAIDGLTCHGELFNPHFIGHEGVSELFGVDLKRRDSDPVGLIGHVRDRTEGLAGFRLFSDHDPRVIAQCLSNRRCAKIVLTRNPAESYVSLKIARATGQWWMGDLPAAKVSRTRFDADEFSAYLSDRAAFLARIRRALQETGQTAYWIDASEIGERAVIDGLARYLGAEPPDKGRPLKGKVQNPAALGDKVTNPKVMEEALAGLDPFSVWWQPDFEPARGPNVPAFRTTDTPPLLYLPVKCALDREVEAWLAALSEGALGTGHTQKKLRSWKRAHPGHLSFTVVRHPLARAYEAFCRFILPTEGPAFLGIRHTLATRYGVDLPEDPAAPSYDLAAHARAFEGFLGFVKGNLKGQTSVRVDGAWASQTAILHGVTRAALPDRVIRAERLPRALEEIAADLGVAAPELPAEDSAGLPPLAAIYDDTIEAAARAAYQKDYMMFGYRAWDQAA